jgi:hypothetical protein
MPASLLDEAQFRSKINAVLAAYYALKEQGRYGRPTDRRVGKEGENSGGILDRSDGVRISICIAEAATVLGNNNANCPRILSRAQTWAMLILQKARVRSQEFGVNLPIIVMAAKAVYDITSRASAYAAGTDTKPDCIETCFPSGATSIRFSNHLTKWWTDYVPQANIPAWSTFTWTRDCWDNEFARSPNPSPSPSPPSSPAPSDHEEDPQEQQRRARQEQQQRAADEKAARERQKKAHDNAERQRRKDERQRHNQRAQAAKDAANARRRKEAEEEETRRTAEAADEARRESERAAAEEARREEERRQREDRKREDEDSRELRDEAARRADKRDREVQQILFKERLAKPFKPPPKPIPEPSKRPVDLPARISPDQRAGIEARRAEEIMRNIAAARSELDKADTPELRAAAEAALDAAIADSKRYPAFPYRTDGLGPGSKLQAIDRLHPVDFGVTFVAIAREHPLEATEKLAEIHGGLAQPYIDALEKGDVVETDRILKFVSASYALFMRKCTRKGDSRQRRFNLYDDGKLDTLVAEFLFDAREAEDKAVSDLPDEQANVLARVMFLMARGEVAKAVAAAIPGAVNDTSEPAVLEQLKQRVGLPRTKEMPGELDGGVKGFKKIKISVEKTFRGLKRLKGTGPNNVPSEILIDIARCFPKNPLAEAAMTLHQAIADEYLSGDQPAWYYALNVIAELVPLAKSTGSIDVRPISMSDTATRAFKAAAARQAYGNAKAHFGRVQLGAGVRGGTQTQAFGPILYLENAVRTEVVVCLDIANAFSSMSRKAACEALMSSTDENIRALVQIFHAANFASPRAKGIDVIIQEGGGQGCPLMPGVFAEVYLKALLNLKKKDQVEGVLAFLDDTTVVGRLENVLPAVIELAEEIKKLGLELNLGKCVIVPKDANAVRSAMVELSAKDERYANFTIATMPMPEADAKTAVWGEGIGAMIAGTPVGDDRFIHYQFDRIAREALDDTLHVTGMVKGSSEQAAAAILRISAHSRLTHLAMTVRPTISELYLEMYNRVLIEEYLRLTGIRDFAEDLETVEEAQLLWYRLKSSQRVGGAGMSDLEEAANQHFVNAFTMGIPGLITRRVKGETIEGCIPVLSQLLGNNFGDNQGDGRWRKATSVPSMKKSATCRSFYWAYRSLQMSVADDDKTAPVTGILATPAEAVGIVGGEPNGGEVHKLASLIALQRAEKMKVQADRLCDSLLPGNPIRVAYINSKKHRAMSEFVATCPTPANVLSNVHFQTVAARFFGLPIPTLVDHVGIKLPHSKSQIHLDPHGHNIAKADSIQGNENKIRHDTILSALADMLRVAGITFRMEDLRTFEGARRESSKLPPIIPDLAVETGGLGTPVLYDLKVIGAGTNWYRPPNAEGDAVEVRATRVDQDYRTAAEKHDEEHGIDTATRILRRHGKVRGLVVGAMGEFSKDLSELIVKAAMAAGSKNWAERGEESAKRAQAVYRRLFRRKIALAAVRAQAVWLSNRLEHARAQNDGCPGPSWRARAQSRRARMDHEEYMWANAGWESAHQRRG